MVLSESVSVSNVSKRPIVRCLQRFKNATLGLDYSSHLSTLLPLTILFLFIIFDQYWLAHLH
jgi:hypothetical protein